MQSYNIFLEQENVCISYLLREMVVDGFELNKQENAFSSPLKLPYF